MDEYEYVYPYLLDDENQGNETVDPDKPQKPKEKE